MTAIDSLLALAEDLAAFCRRHGIVRLAVFGSALHDELQEASDVDLLVEFAVGRTPGLLTMASLELELEELVGREVELRTAQGLSSLFRDDVRREACEPYAAA